MSEFEVNKKGNKQCVLPFVLIDLNYCLKSRFKLSSSEENLDELCCHSSTVSTI